MTAMDIKEYTFALEMKVRDYEVDVQGIVNNARYLHYLEHTRHEFCDMAGTSFREMHSRGIDPVLSRVEIDYLTPLGLGDTMTSCLNISRRGPRFIFQQDIYNSRGEAVVKAMVTVVTLENGRISRGDVLDEAFRKYLK